jgi:hypothetical protein
VVEKPVAAPGAASASTASDAVLEDSAGLVGCDRPKPEPPERVLPSFSVSTVALMALLVKWSARGNHSTQSEATLAQWEAILSGFLQTWVSLPVSFTIFGHCAFIVPGLPFHGQVPGCFQVNVAGQAAITFESPKHSTAQRVMKSLGRESGDVVLTLPRMLQRLLMLGKKDLSIARQVLCTVASLVEATSLCKCYKLCLCFIVAARQG